MGLFMLILLWTMSSAILRSLTSDTIVRIYTAVYVSVYGLYRYGLFKGNPTITDINRKVKEFDDLIPKDKRTTLYVVVLVAGIAVAFL